MFPKLKNCSSWGFSVQSLLHRRNCRLVKRLVRKSGRSSILRNTENSQHTFRYMRDLSNTLIEGSWKWTLLAVCVVFNLTWLVFAGLWMIVSSESMDVDGEPCLEGKTDRYIIINSFTDTKMQMIAKLIKMFEVRRTFLEDFQFLTF